MNNTKLLNNFKCHLLIFFFICSTSFAQSNSLSIGAYGGLGAIRGNSPALTAVSGSVFVNYSPYFWQGLSIKNSVIYNRKVEYFLPEDRSEDKYYPYVWGFSTTALLYQILGGTYLKEGIGISVLNDRTYSDVNQWGAGFIGNFEGGFIFEDHNLSFGAGTDIAQTFINASINYFNVYIVVEYYLR